MGNTRRTWIAIPLLGIVAVTVDARDQAHCEGLEPGSLPSDFLETCRPEPIGAIEKDAVLQSLPPEGEVRMLTSAERRKVSAIGTVLRRHARVGVYEVKVIDVPQAWTGMHGRAVLLISRPALDLLAVEEIQALAAHEAGHEYVWEEFARARDQGDEATLRRLELLCDTIAAATLQSIGVPAQRLISATEKAFRYNRERFGTALNAGAYPALAERRHVVERVMSQGHRVPATASRAAIR
ncbi:MAG TPA: hypothetical protein VNY05_16700 [Candidatus Acidoferrales bacterium]|jgi:Zn-dependent protease with chaperone function|nr:hypothetical protein [Candidatus Acidoferrales bacterium]